MRKLPRLEVTIELDLELVFGGVLLVHVERYGELVDLWAYLDDRGQWRACAPCRALQGHLLPTHPAQDETPALATVLDRVIAEELQP